MNPAQKELLKGAIKSAVGAATGLIIALPVADPEKFSIASLGGWLHIGSVVLFVVIVAEARFWNQWANSGKPQ